MQGIQISYSSGPAVQGARPCCALCGRKISIVCSPSRHPQHHHFRRNILMLKTWLRQLRQLFFGTKNRTGRAAETRRNQGLCRSRDVRLSVEQMEDRITPNAAIVSVTDGPTGVAQPTAW